LLISLPHPTQMLHFGQFALPSSSMGVQGEISFRHPGINGRMHLLQAYRSLPRPSSLIKPSHPPTGVFAPAFLLEFDVLQLIQFYGNSYIINLPRFCQVDHLFFCMTIITSHVLASSFISSIYEEIAYDLVTQYFTHDCPTSNLRR
jgi:hypothetical protein